MNRLAFLKEFFQKISENIKQVLKNRKLKYGTNSLIMVAAVIAIAVFVNVLVGMASLKWDLTANKRFSIGDTTKNILKELKKDIVVYGLFDDGLANSDNQYKELMELLSQYEKYPHIKVEYVDPDKKPGFIKSLDPDNVHKISKGDFVFKCENKIKKLSASDLYQTQFDYRTFSQYITGSNAEQSFTGAVKFVSSDKTPTVYFLEGHEEGKVDEEYTTVKEYLEKNNYAVKTLNLLMQSKIPDDTEILVIASPKKDITSDEKEKIKAYMEKGGKALVLVDSLESNPSFEQLEDFLKDYNVSLNYDKVKENDENRHVPENSYDIVPELQSNEINKALNPEKFVMIMPKSRSLNILKNEKHYITVKSLMKTSKMAVGEQIDKSRGKDIQGPLDLALAVESKASSKPSKLLVMGNGYFMSDRAVRQYQQYSVNGLYFFLNSLLWMQDKDNDVIIAPKSYSMERLEITQTQAVVTSLALIVVLPLLILGAGMFVWMRRRHL